MKQRASFVHIVRRDEWPWIIRDNERTIPRCLQVQLNVSKRCVPSTAANQLPSSFSSLSHCLPPFVSFVPLFFFFFFILLRGLFLMQLEEDRRAAKPTRELVTIQCVSRKQWMHLELLVRASTLTIPPTARLFGNYS